MPDITAITAIINGIKTATDIAKFLKDADISLEKAELKLQIAELINSLADTKISITEIQKIIEEKDNEIAKLKKGLELQSKLVRHNEVYYEVDDTGKPTGDPYCPYCYEVDHTAVHIYENPDNRNQCICPSCKNKLSHKAKIEKNA